MSTKGRHAGDDGSFYRDLLIMVLGILGVGALVFFVMFLFARDTTSETTTSTTSAATSSSTDAGQTSTTATSTTSSTSTSSTSTTIPIRPNEDLRVVVLNSVGIGGAAGRLTQVIADAGYQTLEADDYRPEQDPSKVWYREGFSAEAARLADLLTSENGSVFDVEVLEDDTLQPGADLIVVLGTGYTE